MKKILIGLFALSILELGIRTVSRSADSGASIEVTTRAFVMNSGLIVTDSPTGTAALSSLTLDHGSITAGQTSAVASDIYIRNVTGNEISQGTAITMQLTTAQGNVLTGSSVDSTITHTLLAAVAREDAQYIPGTGDNNVKDNVLTLTGDMTTNTGSLSLIHI